MVRPAHDNAALKGVRVLELTDQIGQYAGKLMADMGADVIKVEPVTGSSVRHIGPFEHDVPDANRSLTFWHYNTSKRGITLNLETPDGKQLFLDLAKTADVVIESFRPGYLASLGLGYADLKAVNPKLVVCSITHFGQSGPWADFEASDMIHLALGGTMASSGYSKSQLPDAPPIAPTGGNAYHTASHFATSGILVALLHAKRSGEGQYIDVAVHDATSVTTEGAFPNWVYDGKIVFRNTGQHAGIAPMTRWNFRTKDGHMLNTLLMAMNAQRWQALFEWMDSTGDADDLLTKYKSPAEIMPDIFHVTDVVGRFVGNHDLDYLYHGGQKLRLPWSPIRPIDETKGDAHLEARGMFHKVDYPESKTTYTHLGAPYSFSRSTWEIRGRAPLLGEHNEEILVGELGVSKDRLSILAEAGVL